MNILDFKVLKSDRQKDPQAHRHLKIILLCLEMYFLSEGEGCCNIWIYSYGSKMTSFNIALEQRSNPRL